MKGWNDLHFSPEGESPLDVTDCVRVMAGLPFVAGDHDLAFDWGTVE